MVWRTLDSGPPSRSSSACYPEAFTERLLSLNSAAFPSMTPFLTLTTPSFPNSHAFGRHRQRYLRCHPTPSMSMSTSGVLLPTPPLTRFGTWASEVPEQAPRSKPLSVSLALVHTIKCFASSVRTEPVTRPPLSHEDNVVSFFCVLALGRSSFRTFPMAAATGEILCGEFAAQE